jgi:hypothetical protein
MVNSNSTNSSGSHTLSFWLGVYTRNASSLSLLASASRSIAVTHSGQAGSYSWYSGQRLVTMGLTTTLTAGDYWIGFVSRTTSGGANGSYSNLIMSNMTLPLAGLFGTAMNATNQLTLGQGVYTTTTSGLPASVGFSQINGTVFSVRRQQQIMFASGTV